MRPRNILLFILALCYILATRGTYALPPGQLTIEHGPYLVDPAENAITVVWFTNKASTSWVEYCGEESFGVFPVWGGYPQIARSSKHGLIDGNTKRHAIRITNLEPATKYRYRVVSKEILKFTPYEVLYGDTAVGEVLEFETLDPNKSDFSFGVITDLHERPAVLNTLLENTPMDSLDMMLYTGDMLNWMGHEDRIFESVVDISARHFAKEKPLVFVRGNHETRGPNARGLMQYFPHASGKYYYSFTHGSVHFIILDSGEDKPDDHPVYADLVDFDKYRSEQAAWLKKEIQSDKFKKALYKVVLFHVPLFAGSKKHGATDLTQKWGPVLNDGNIDLAINGHHHRYARIEKQEGKNAFPIFVIGQDMILRTDVSDKQLTLTVRDTEGKLIDKYVIPSKLR